MYHAIVFWKACWVHVRNLLINSSMLCSSNKKCKKICILYISIFSICCQLLFLPSNMSLSMEEVSHENELNN
ncbi:hypothetical protein RJT34_11143 [Clitoria ternatea]|uniref:Uncharacterized protein n=1 Tax=Clitoria ternatea TaxID=43366 RepID=A0AAN9JJD2_CLITE